MEPKVLPTNLTDEELLELSAKNDANRVLEDDVYLFVSTFNLQVGNNRVSSDFLYSIYSKWSKRRVTKDLFLDKLTEVFASESVSKKIFVLLDSSVASITRSMLDLSQPDNFKRTTVHSSVEKFKTDLDLQPAKSWVGEIELLKLYREWCARENRKFIKREDLLDTLEVLFVSRFTKRNLREFALTYKLKEAVEEEKETPTEP